MLMEVFTQRAEIRRVAMAGFASLLFLVSFHHSDSHVFIAC
jgi:hypothetical protein